MTFGEKIKNARLALNLSQIELAEKAGVTERSIYSYEQTGTFPKSTVLKRLAEALNVTVSYLLDESETDKHANIDQELFLNRAKRGFGYKGALEAREVVSRAAALFAGGELDNEAKDVFFQSLMEVYLESKAEARDKFSGRRRISRKKNMSP
ncbi:MAG: helix-turn-helix domain-containing protein [Oscillospiraceae bacterium]|jgi:transcriptional regulator with XRE-family HTH domain|nr:helix-turn-helix domain-containing protein [Oscillospiraceae bacterium]